MMAPRRVARLLKWVTWLFVLGGAAALAWCAFIVTDASIVQQVARDTLQSMPRAETSIPNSSNSSNAAASRIVVSGTPLAELSIPRVGLSAVVFHGSDARTHRPRDTR